ncbi:MAG: BLUF domain-containing protein [Rubrivivax sp.]
MTDLYTLLYLSTLTPGTDELVVATIARRARVANAALGISGLLVFDGASFLQRLEGPHDALSRLVQQLRGDPRHVDMDVLCWQPLTGARLHAGWDLAYHMVEDADHALDRIRGRRGDEALAAFDRLASSWDLVG